MCVIIASESGKLPSTELLEQANIDNPDGWGIMWIKKKRIEVMKGMKWQTERLEHALNQTNGSPYVLHFRWATDGSVTKRNCHPFKVNEDIWVAHNGIIRVKMDSKLDRPDSWFFAQELAETVHAYPQWADSGDFIPWLEKWIGDNNKLAFLRTSGQVQIANRKAGIDYEGLWLSNEYSIPELQYLWEPPTWRSVQRPRHGHSQRGSSKPPTCGYSPSPASGYVYSGRTESERFQEEWWRTHDDPFDNLMDFADDEAAIDSYALAEAEADASADGIFEVSPGDPPEECDYCGEPQTKLFLHGDEFLCAYCKRIETLYEQSQRGVASPRIH